MWYIHAMEYYTVIKNDVLKNIDVWTWKDVHYLLLYEKIGYKIVYRIWLYFAKSITYE